MNPRKEAKEIREALGRRLREHKSKAKKQLKAMVQRQVEEALLARKNQGRRILGCTDGTVLAIAFRYGAWSYDIAGPGRKHASGVVGFKTIEEATAGASKHAAASYGGVAWECY